MNIQDIASQLEKSQFGLGKISIELYSGKWFLGQLSVRPDSPMFEMHFSVVNLNERQMRNEVETFDSIEKLVTELNSHAYRFDLASFRKC